MKNTIKNLILWSSFILIMGTALAYGVYNLAVFIENPVPVYAMAEVKVPKIEIYKGETETAALKRWSLEMFEKNGINPLVADCVIFKESGWDPNAVNENSIDLGLMQWNVQHIKSGYISLKCAGDPRCAVEKAISKIKEDNSFRAWMGHKDAKCSKFGKTFIK